MELTAEQGRLLVWGDLEGWSTIEEETVDTTRWSIIKDGVFKHEESGLHYSTSWSVGATECQDERPFEYNDPELVEVVAVEKTITTWQPKTK